MHIRGVMLRVIFHSLLFPECVVVTVSSCMLVSARLSGSTFSRPCSWVFKLLLVRTFNKHGCDKYAYISSYLLTISSQRWNCCEITIVNL